ncbi:MAG: hypothetical protein HN981_03625 [Candidatus Pacebacteria bacterium]|jgi:hypothetical protein|nr:hypothetical protein [Candidatus Paceibacterota bacterium]MBT4652287.1 hypothetical protein [Candidatus Paceibacterota bacterium]MBT6756480.1 hypothetical protein [Candidatus Paceibacterota bacterium]MBT6921453.1 hypothetical protein [Candidatus Paceibacterota bacterium]
MSENKFAPPEASSWRKPDKRDPNDLKIEGWGPDDYPNPDDDEGGGI